MRLSPRWLVSGIALLVVAGAGLLLLPPVLRTEPPASGEAGFVDWAAALAGIPAEGFDRPSDTWTLDLPADHGAHPRMRTETWTISAHLRSEGGETMGAQFALLRLGLVPPDSPVGESDWAPRALYRGYVALFDGETGETAGEERFNRAVLGLAGDDAARREVWLDNWSVEYAQGPASNQLRLDARVGEVDVDLRFTPAKPAVSPAGSGAPFRGFSITRMSVRGSIGPEGDREPVAGSAWIDHLWGDVPLPVGPIAWDRLQVQLDDGTDVALFRTRRRDGSGTPSLDGFAVDRGGVVEQLPGASLDPVREWRRDGSSASYPVEWLLVADDLRLRISPVADDQVQDFVTPVWSGLVQAQGNLRGRAVSGHGTLQLTGYAAQ